MGMRPCRMVLVRMLLFAAPAARGRILPTTNRSPPSSRDRLCDDLAIRAAEFEARNILKQVVKLARPSVVHIEAKKEETGRASFYGRSRMVEEAGSGVIVQ